MVEAQKWTFAVCGRKLVLTRTTCEDSVVIALVQQQGSHHSSPTAYLTLGSRTAPLHSLNTHAFNSGVFLSFVWHDDDDEI